MYKDGNNIGTILKQHRLIAKLTVQQLSIKSGVSVSYLNRIENEKCSPSYAVLRKLTKPLGIAESELFTSAGYIPTQQRFDPLCLPRCVIRQRLSGLNNHKRSNGHEQSFFDHKSTVK